LRLVRDDGGNLAIREHPGVVGNGQLLVAKRMQELAVAAHRHFQREVLIGPEEALRGEARRDYASRPAVGVPGIDARAGLHDPAVGSPAKAGVGGAEKALALRVEKGGSAGFGEVPVLHPVSREAEAEGECRREVSAQVATPYQ